MERNTAVRKATKEAIARGYQIIPLAPKLKRPLVSGWPHFRWPDDVTEDQIAEQLETWAKGEDINLGVILGDASGRLVDVDLDHYRTARLKEQFLPPTLAKSGRAGKPNSHYWYICEEGSLPGTRQHLMPRTEQDDGTWKKGPVIVELRSNGAQTAIPPSVHPSDEDYTWSGDPWGGATGPAVINGRRLQVQVALLALACVLLESWPTSGSRHEAYLALAGGLLREGDSGVHPFWERNAGVLIRALADATLDEEGPDAREAECIPSTIDGLNNGRMITGFGKLSELLGDEAVRQIRILVGEVESAAGVPSRQATSVTVSVDAEIEARKTEVGALAMEDRDPLEERVGSWQVVDLEPYLSGQLSPVEPTVMRREDGQSLIYPGRVNMLYGSSESAKSWIALFTCMQEMTFGERVMYLDFEDEPVNTLDRLKRMGAGDDDLRFRFSYIRPEDPLSPMQRDRWGNDHKTPAGIRNQEIFQTALDIVDPTLIIADGMTVLYGLHGLDSNDAVSTDIITGWLKKLTRNGRSTVLIIDHTSKGPERGSTPIGSQHKQAMVQGTMIQVWPVRQPMPDAIGEVELIVLKDRPGQVRKISVKSGTKAQLAAKVLIDSTPPTTEKPLPTQLRIVAPPDPNDTAKSKAEEKARRIREDEEQVILDMYGGIEGTTFPISAILVKLGLTRDKENKWQPAEDAKRYAKALERVIDQGYIVQEGKTRAATYTLIVAPDPPDALNVDLTNDGTDD